jgi:carbonic anhydrase/acetyltransferase-like protein (isoleucine patch superfamily)
MPLLPYLRTLPEVEEDVAIDPAAYVIGKVAIANGATIGPRSVVRGDQSHIKIGRRFRMGSSSTIHVDFGFPTIIGDDVILEDRAVVHGCTVGDAVLVESEATVLTGSVIGEGSIVQADALVPEGREIPARSVVAGTPGRVIRQTTDEEVAGIRARAVPS